jgi:COMPASS component BRE2
MLTVGSAENKKGFRYNLCVADPTFPHKQYYRQSEIAPHGAKMSVEDSDRNIYFDPTCRIVTNEKGWRMSRANVYAREGSLYYEVKILKGIPADGSNASDAGPSPHVRMGWARREAPLDAPVGFDGYSYAVCDTKFDTMHRSRLGKFLPQGKTKKHTAAQPDHPLEPLRTNDVVGLLITLPPQALHRKVVAGTYNPAVDFTSTPDPNALPPDIIRDRIPVPFRGNVYFENGEYQPTKPMTQYSDRAPVNDVRPHANHEDVPLRSLPGSSIKVYKNGELAGTAFDGLMAFLPPASAPAAAAGVRQGLDDGSLGYYPAVSVFFGGVAEVNFGPDFWCPPGELKLNKAPEQDGGTADESVMRPRGIWERYNEQIAEDVVWDVIDEAAFFVLDGGHNATVGGIVGIPVSARGSGNLQDE